MNSFAANNGLLEAEAERPQAGDALVAALLSGGDSRIGLDRVSGTNKYLCPPRPAPGLTCLASCTASPVAQAGFARATKVFREVAGAPSRRAREQRLEAQAETIRAGLLRYFGAASWAQAILCPSGTDALLTASLLLAAERPGRAMTAILPAAAETGTGVPLAAACRQFDGVATGQPVTDAAVATMEIPLRTPAGQPRDAAAVSADFARAAAAAAGRAIVVLTHSTKTGLIAPAAPPEGGDVIVDACQARIAPAEVIAYLRRGWPVVVTGSKFFGGPAFSGAVLFPRARCSRPEHDAAGLGTVLRWTAALAAIDAFAPQTAGMAPLLQARAATITDALAGCDALVPIDGLQPRGALWSDLPSIFTIAVRDAADATRLMSIGELRPLHERLARGGILVGQPVGLGGFGGLRIAIGARDLIDGGDANAVVQAIETLARLAVRPAG